MTSLPQRYQPNGQEACGGFSKVMFCNDIRLERKVAIKFVQNEEEKRRIIDELRALMQVRSKHVVQVYDIIPRDERSFGIVEEYIEGEDLCTSLFPSQSLDNYLKTLWQIASGIAGIHAAGIIHRDIKPNNMKLDGEGVVKIFDFGLARDVGPAAATKGFKGTYGFAAPELFSTQTVSFSTAIDTYAFGAMAVYLVSHSLPPELMGLPPRPILGGYFSTLPIGIPSTLCGLFENCLSFNPSDRPPMQTIANEISRFLLRNKHQAVMVHNGNASSLNSRNKKVHLEFPSVGKVEIVYDGLFFNVSIVEGEVFINNNSARIGMHLPGSCIIALGGGHRKANNRAFIAFDISNPEVLI